MALYEISHSPDGLDPWSTPVEVLDEEEYEITGLTNGEDHFARVRSKNEVSGNVSGWSAVVSATPTN